MISATLIVAAGMAAQYAPGMGNQAPPMENHTAFGTIYTRGPGSASPPPSIAGDPRYRSPRYASPFLPGVGSGPMGVTMSRRPPTTRGNQPRLDAAAYRRAQANAAGAAKIRARAAARGR